MLRIKAPQSVTTFASTHPPAATVDFDESFVCETHDCYAGQIDSERVLRPDIDMADFNRATGPVRIRGARPGDGIRIEIEEIDIAATGTMALAPGLGVLGDRILASDTRRIPIRDGAAWVTDHIAVPLEPMIGVLGIAPDGIPVPTAWPGVHGGNLDTRLLRAGTALHLTVAREGALLAVGDLHAVQGDGELGGTGVEIAGAVQLRVSRTDLACALPLVRHEHGLSVLASSADLETAIRNGFSQAVDLMRRWHDLSWNEAYRLTSIVAHAEVSQVVNPHVTARITLPQRWCQTEISHEVVQ